MRLFNLLFLSIMMLLLSSCSHLADGNRVSAPSNNTQNLPPLKVPPNMALAFDNLYPIPERHYTDKNKQVDITPPTLSAGNYGKGWF